MIGKKLAQRNSIEKTGLVAGPLMPLPMKVMLVMTVMLAMEVMLALHAIPWELATMELVAQVVRQRELNDYWRKLGRAVSSCWNRASIPRVGLSGSVGLRGDCSTSCGGSAGGSSSWNGWVLSMAERLLRSVYGDES